MNNEKGEKETRTPITVMMDMAKKEIGAFVILCMEKNKIPPGLMAYILKDILLDIMQAKTEQLSAQYVDLQAGSDREA